MAKQVSPEELVSVLERTLSAHGGPAIMAADCDGTVWRGDVGEELFELAVRERRLQPAAVEGLLGEARAHRIEVTVEAENDANLLGEILLASHREGTYPNAPAFAMMAWAFAGLTEKEMNAVAARTLTEGNIAERLRPEIEHVHAWGRERDVPLWLVSASPYAVVLEGGRRMGIPPERVVAMQPQVANGVLTSELASEPTYREGKLRRLRAVTDVPLLAAFGDSYWDHALIEEAMVGVAVAPNPELRARIAEHPNGYVIAS